MQIRRPAAEQETTLRVAPPRGRSQLPLDWSKRALLCARLAFLLGGNGGQGLGSMSHTCDVCGCEEKYAGEFLTHGQPPSRDYLLDDALGWHESV